MIEPATAPGAGARTEAPRPHGGRNVIILSYHYPPAPEVGGLRARRLAASFAARGDRVHVIAGPLSGHETEVIGSITVHRIEPSLDLRGLYRRLRRGRPSAANPAALAAGDPDAASWKPPARTSFLKRQIASAMWLPDDRQGWILPAATLARRLAATGRDLVYSTAPPFSVHLAALLAARRTGARWVAEFRDPWTGNPWKPAFVRSAWSDATDRWLERRCLRRADLIVTVTEDMGLTLRTRAGHDANAKVIVIRSGIDELAPVSRRDTTTVHSMAYVGTLYQNRDPRPFLRALATLQARGATAGDLRVDFIGACRWFAGSSVENMVADLGLRDVVRFTDTLPHAECLDRIRSCDMLLLFARNQPQQVPNKLYEYLGVRRPILAFADAGGETARMLERLGGHFIVDSDDPLLVERMLEAALRGPPPPARPDVEAVLEEWTAGHQLEVLHEELASRFE